VRTLREGELERRRRSSISAAGTSDTELVLVRTACTTARMFDPAGTTISRHRRTRLRKSNAPPTRIEAPERYRKSPWILVEPWNGNGSV